MAPLVIVIDDSFSEGEGKTPAQGDSPIQLGLGGGDRIAPSASSGTQWVFDVDDLDTLEDADIVRLDEGLGLSPGVLRAALADTGVVKLVESPTGDLEVSAGRLAQPIGHLPGGHDPVLRLAPRLARELPTPAIAGTPTDNLSLPVNGVAVREASTYLEPEGDLTSFEDGLTGRLYEVTTYWEPLGWALEEWNSTTWLAPDEDTIVAAGDITATSERSTQGDESEEAGSFGRAEGGAITSESSTASASQTGRSSGFQFGLGQQTSEGLSINVDPVAALTKAVTGAVQLGYSSSNMNASSAVEGELRRQVANTIQQQAGQKRLRISEGVSAATNRFYDERRLRAFRNLAADASCNLAVFSIAKQWLVTTAQSRIRNVVFCRIEDCEKPFGPEDLFIHRDVLAATLRDTSLLPALHAAADSFVPGERTDREVEPSAAAMSLETTLVGARLTARVEDPAKGNDSVIRVAACFDAGGGEPYFVGDATDASTTGADISWQLDLPTPPPLLRDLSRWEIEFDNPKIKWDRKAILTSVTAHLELQDGGEIIPLEVPLAERLTLKAGRRHPVGRSRLLEHVPSAAARAQSTAERKRLIAHLDANRAAYRLAIDLVTDPVIRFERLSARQLATMPVDMQPLGVAGRHIAYLGPGEVEDSASFTPIVQLVSTPSEGTFTEVVHGHKSEGLPDRAVRSDHPSLTLVEKASTVAWPAITPPGFIDIVQQAGKASEAVTPPTAPVAGAAELGSMLGETVTALGKLTDALKAAEERAKAAIPTTEKPTPPEVKANDTADQGADD